MVNCAKTLFKRALISKNHNRFEIVMIKKTKLIKPVQFWGLIYLVDKLYREHRESKTDVQVIISTGFNRKISGKDAES